MRQALIILAIFTIVLCGTVARADAVPSAEDLYAQGQTAYELADYATAITKWQASYDLSGEHMLLFNIAQAERQAGDCARAIATYRKFLAADQDATSDQHKLAEDFVRELESPCRAHLLAAVVDSQPADPASTPATTLSIHQPISINDQGHARRLAGIAVGGAGIAALAGGIALGHHGQTLGDEVTAACAVSCDWTVQKSKDSAGRTDVAIGYALDAVGVAAIVGGAVTYYLGVRGSGVVVTPRSEGGASVSWGGSW